LKKDFFPSEGIAIFDHNLTMVYANNSFEELYNSLDTSSREKFSHKIKNFEYHLRSSGKTFISKQLVLLPAGNGVNISVYLLNKSRSNEMHILVFVEPGDHISRLPKSVPAEITHLGQNTRQTSSQKRSSPFSELIGEDPKIKTVLLTAQKAAKTDYPVLITGESGTGKEIVARIIHRTSARSKNKFVDVNCAAIPDQLIDSELFGYEKGAFTGAKSSGRDGLFYEAHQGTLFLDEIGDASPQTQAKLLRVLDRGYFRRIGGNKNIEVDIRIISATNKDLSQMIQSGDFREDLLYRLNTISIYLPPLRDRPKDIPLLAKHFLKEHAREQKLSLTFSRECLDILSSYHWPGNVRELKAVVDYAVTMAAGSYIITVDCLPDFLLSRDQQNGKNCGFRFHSSEERRKLGPLSEIIQRVEEAVIREALQKAKNKSEAIRMLGISRRTFYTKIKQYNLE